VLYLIVACISMAACKDESRENTPDFDRSEMLNNIASNIVVPAYENARLSVDALSESFSKFESQPNADNLTLLKEQFLATYLEWQTINLFEFGPADELSLKSNLNLYPASEYKIETNISEGNFDLNQLQNKDAKGFPAIDYLLFARDENTTLDDFTNGITGNKRMAYLKTLIASVKDRITAVADEWTGSSGYATGFISKTGTDAGSALGLLVNSLNKHLESDFRDGKLGIPLGVRSAGVPIPDNVEAYYSEYSAELFRKNFDAMERLYLGKYGETDGVGLDDHLDGVDAAELNQRITTQFDVIRSKVIELNLPLNREIETNSLGLNELYQEIQKLIVLLKVELPSRFSVLISYQDNDGD